MMPFQLSPVAQRKRVSSATGSEPKLAWRSMKSPSVTLQKRCVPSTAKMNIISASSTTTFDRLGSDCTSVCSSTRSASPERMTRRMRATRKRRMMRSSMGETGSVVPVLVRPTSSNEPSTMSRSKRFHALARYLPGPKAVSLSTASRKKAPVKTQLASVSACESSGPLSYESTAMQSVLARMSPITPTSKAGCVTRSYTGCLHPLSGLDARVMAEALSIMASARVHACCSGVMKSVSPSCFLISLNVSTMTPMNRLSTKKAPTTTQPMK
mmetsp:Transcript_19074/g.48576  ORF Transcript_19074/g.48576 Transcript_19074/m.48576 type:complete len:269 (-) Transcript_19074:2961-3767(-)